MKIQQEDTYQRKPRQIGNEYENEVNKTIQKNEQTNKRKNKNNIKARNRITDFVGTKIGLHTIHALLETQSVEIEGKRANSTNNADQHE